MMRIHRNRHLVSAEAAFNRFTVPCLRTRPAFRGAENDDRPNRHLRFGCGAFTGFGLDRFDFFDSRIQHLRHDRMHRFRIGPFHEQRLPAHAVKVLRQFFVRFTVEDRRIGDFAAVQVQDRQDSPIRDRIDEHIGEPTSRQRTGFSFPVTDDSRRDHFRIVEDSAGRVRKRIAEFAALMDRAGCFRCRMGSDPAGEGELFVEFRQAFQILGDVRIDFRIGTVQIGVRNHDLATMSRSFDVEHVQVIFVDDAVQVGIDEILSGDGSPVADWMEFHISRLDRALQQRIVLQVQLSHGDEIGGAPEGIHLVQIRF